MRNWPERAIHTITIQNIDSILTARIYPYKLFCVLRRPLAPHGRFAALRRYAGTLAQPRLIAPDSFGAGSQRRFELTPLSQFAAELPGVRERVALELRRQHTGTTDQAADARPAGALCQLQASHSLRYPLIRVTEVAER